MASPVGFEGARDLFQPAPGDEDKVLTLPAFVHDAQIIHCWRLTAEELDEVRRTGVVWVSMFTHGPPPPILISGEALVKITEVDGTVRPAKAEPNLNRGSENETIDDGGGVGRIHGDTGDC